MAVVHPEGFTVVEIMRRIDDERRYPHVGDILEDLRLARGVSLESFAKDIGRDVSTARRYLQGRKEDHIRQCAVALGLEDKMTELLVQKQQTDDRDWTKNPENRKHPKLFEMSPDEFALVVKSALDYYGKSVQELAPFVKLSDQQSKYIEQGGGAEKPAETFSPFVDRGTDQGRKLEQLISMHGFSYDQRKEILHAFKTMLNDPAYGEHELLEDAKGSFALKFRTHRSDEPGHKR